MKTPENSTPFVQVIYTLDQGMQQYANLKLLQGMFDSKEHFEALLLWVFESKRNFYSEFGAACDPNPPFRVSPTIVKMSCCVYEAGNNIETPDWYHECNGKFYFTQVA